MTALDEQLQAYLSDAHSIEAQALAQLRAAPSIAGDPRLAAIFREHRGETEEHERLVAARLEARGGRPAALKEAAMKAGGVGFVLFARFQPDTPGKLVTHAFSYEHMELAAYELLMRVAERAGDTETVEVARSIREQERAMAERLAGAFDIASEASLRAAAPADLDRQVDGYLTDAHAIEAQAVQLLQRAPRIGGEPELDRMYADHLGETREQQALIEERLAARGGAPSRLKDAAMRLGALNWGFFFQAQPDTPGKLAAFAYAFEHLEIGGYEQLLRVARRAGDERTAALAERILPQERAMAERLAAGFDRAAEASLQAQQVAG